MLLSFGNEPECTSLVDVIHAKKPHSSGSAQSMSPFFPPLAVKVHKHVLPGSLTWHMSTLQSGAWDDVSGETFLRNLLSMPLEHAKWTTVSPLISSIDKFSGSMPGSMHQHAASLSIVSHCQAAVHVMADHCLPIVVLYNAGQGPFV